MGKFPRLIAALTIGVISTCVCAEYPDKPLRLVVPYPPGGNVDATARIVAAGLSLKLGQQVIVDNRAGATGVIGAEAVKRAAPDGYTFLLASSGGLAPVSAFNPSLKLDPGRDFASAGTIAKVSTLLVVNATLPINTVAELISYAKASPGKLKYGSAGIGGTGHLTGELFQSASGASFLHVPYKGNSQAMMDLLGGQIDFMFDQPASSLPNIDTGKLRALGVTTLTRTSVAPDLKTLNESGLLGFDVSTTAGLLLPVGTPKEILDKLSSALVQVLRMPQTKKQFQVLGADVTEGSGEDFIRIVRLETEKWTQVIRDANVKMP